MNADGNVEIQAEKEVLRVLQKNCRVMRSTRNRPELAGPASRWEVQINQRLQELERLATPDLPLKAAAA